MISVLSLVVAILAVSSARSWHGRHSGRSGPLRGKPG